MPWTEYQRRRATHDEVKGWFSRWPDSRIGLVTGAISGIMVVDADNADIHQKLETELLPDNLITPKATSPHGWHYYFQHHPKIRNGTEVAGLKGLDTRGEGGFIMAPPNPALNGAGYAWVLGMEPWTIPVAPLPDKLLKLLLSSSAAYSSAASTRARTLVWKKGGRDDTLFRVANCLIKGGMSPDHVAEVVEQLALKVCDPPFDPVEAAEKTKSAQQRAERKDRRLIDDIRDWIAATDSHFTSRDIHRELGLVERNHKKNVATILSRLCDDGLIEKSDDKRGSWRVVDKTYKEQSWWQDQGQPLPLRMPLDAGDFIRLYPGNIVLVEGAKSQGKSAFALEFCRLNKGLYPGRILYQNVEMADSELLERFMAYGDVMTPEEWRQSVIFVRQTDSWWDKVLPDGINVVDYLIEYKESYLVPDYIWKIHQKLKTGIALILLQRDPRKPYGHGGRAVRDIPRAVISLMRHKIRLEDVKSYFPSVYGNPSGLCREYKQVNWWEFKAGSEWNFEEDLKYASFK